MKTKLRIITILSAFIILFITGCNNRAEEIQETFNSYANCVNSCNDLEAKYHTEYDACKKQCLDEFNEAREECNTLECANRALNYYLSCVSECEAAFNSRMEEVRQCRIECNKLITISEE